MRPLRVLLVDDSEDMRLLSRLVLEGDPSFDVCGEASDGEEAIALAASTEPDVIVLDIEMPGMDGLTALPLLREQNPRITVIVMSAVVTPHVRASALTLGAHAVLEKSPAALAQMCALLTKAGAPVGVLA